MVAGANGASGVSVLRQSVAYKQEQENVLDHIQHMVERTAMEPEQLWEIVVTCPAAMKVDKDENSLCGWNLPQGRESIGLEMYYILSFSFFSISTTLSVSGEPIPWQNRNLQKW